MDASGQRAAQLAKLSAVYQKDRLFRSDLINIFCRAACHTVVSATEVEEVLEGPDGPG